MVPYFGKHGAKIFLGEKSIRFGYKIWTLCGSNGYPCHLLIYQGKEPGESPQPLGSRVINDLVIIVCVKSAPKHNILYFNNFFPQLHLASRLQR